MNIEQFIQQHVSRCIESLYGDTGGAPVQIQKTRKEFEGDMTLVVFPLLKLSPRVPRLRPRRSAVLWSARYRKSAATT